MRPPISKYLMSPAYAARACAALLLLALPKPAASQGGSPPSVELYTPPAPGETISYHSGLSWLGTDLDGTVDGYRYAIDPPPLGEPYWIGTSLTSQRFFFKAATLQTPVPASGPVMFADPHTFVIEAIDNDGLQSLPVSRSFVTSTIAPEVQIVSPTPSPAGPVPVATEVTIEWQGMDVDGLFLQQPVSYRYALFVDDALIDAAWANPDAFRDQVAPNFDGWQTASRDSAYLHLQNLVPSRRILLCVVGIDEAGAYSARFSRGGNMIQLIAGVTPTLRRSWGALKAGYR
jgi:hypothetical protein